MRFRTDVFGVRRMARYGLKKLWTKRRLFLPVQDFAAVSYTQENGLERTLWIGNRSMDDYPSDEAAMVWSHSLAAGQETAVWLISMPRRTTVILVPVCNP